MPSRRAYEEAYATFRLEDVEAQFEDSFASGVNACVECCDRWAEPGKVALRWEDQQGHQASVTFVELRERAARFANVLRAHGMGPGDVVACMLPRIPDLLTVALGTWRAGAVYQPMFTAFGPKAVNIGFRPRAQS
jgi:acetyl-CoA synthetase